METKAGDIDGLSQPSAKIAEKEPKVVEEPKANSSIPVEDAPDPEEDDLDDLDGRFYFFSD
jgi:hypothetical protein